MRPVPVFTYWVQRGPGNRPESAVFNYIETPYSQQLRREKTKIKKLVEVMKRVVLETCSPILFPNRRVNPLEVLRRINITIIGRNLDGGGRHSADRFIPVANLTTDRLDEIAEAIIISGTPVSLAEIEWLMVIDQNSLDLGGAVKSNLKWYKKQEKITKLSCEEYSDIDGRINCAAWAINSLISRPNYHHKTAIKRFNQDARNLQTRLGIFY